MSQSSINSFSKMNEKYFKGYFSWTRKSAAKKWFIEYSNESKKEEVIRDLMNYQSDPEMTRNIFEEVFKTWEKGNIAKKKYIIEQLSGIEIPREVFDD